MTHLRLILSFVLLLRLSRNTKPRKFRLIHDLSVPQGASVNSAIPKDEIKVCYDNIDKVVSIVKQVEHRALMAKTDIDNTFRLLPIFPLDRCLLGLTWKSDKGVRQFYVDCCLPMGLSISCRYFEIQLPLVISTPPISTLSLMSNRCPSPVYFSYIFIVF